MSGKRQPTALVEANGRKHLTQAEADERRDREIYMPPADEVTPPKWLPKRLRPEYYYYCHIIRFQDIGIHMNG